MFCVLVLSSLACELEGACACLKAGQIFFVLFTLAILWLESMDRNLFLNWYILQVAMVRNQACTKGSVLYVGGPLFFVVIKGDMFGWYKSESILHPMIKFPPAVDLLSNRNQMYRQRTKREKTSWFFFSLIYLQHNVTENKNFRRSSKVLEEEEAAGGGKLA